MKRIAFVVDTAWYPIPCGHTPAKVTVDRSVWICPKCEVVYMAEHGSVFGMKRVQWVKDGAS